MQQTKGALSFLNGLITALRCMLPLGLCSGLSGCVVVGGSSRGGFFLWPGSLGLVLIIVLFVLLSRRR